MNRWSMVQWALKSQRSLDKPILHRFLQAMHRILSESSYANKCYCTFETFPWGSCSDHSDMFRPFSKKNALLNLFFEVPLWIPSWIERNVCVSAVYPLGCCWMVLVPRFRESQQSLEIKSLDDAAHHDSVTISRWCVQWVWMIWMNDCILEVEFIEWIHFCEVLECHWNQYHNNETIYCRRTPGLFLRRSTPTWAMLRDVLLLSFHQISPCLLSETECRTLAYMRCDISRYQAC